MEIIIFFWLIWLFGSIIIGTLKQNRLEKIEREKARKIEQENREKEEEKLRVKEQKFKDVENGKVKGKILCVDIAFLNHSYEREKRDYTFDLKKEYPKQFESVETFLNPIGKRFEKNEKIKIMTEYGPDCVLVLSATYINDEPKYSKYKKLEILPDNTVVNTSKVKRLRNQEIIDKRIRESTEKIYERESKCLNHDDGWVTLYDEDEDVAYSYNVYTKETRYDDY